jgi:putative transcriptional regulator
MAKNNPNERRKAAVVKEATATFNAAARGNRRPGASSSEQSHYRSPLQAAIHEAATDLSISGLVTKQTMRELDVLCLTSVSALGAEQIKALRTREGVSQAVLARYVNVTPNAVSQWERGEKRPSGSALKMLWLAMNKGLDAIR